MNFDAWLDEPQTVTTRRERFNALLHDQKIGGLGRAMFLSWLRAAYEAQK